MEDEVDAFVVDERRGHVENRVARQDAGRGDEVFDGRSDPC